VELRGQKEDQEVQAARARRARRHLAHAAGDIDRVQEFRKCIECFLCQDVCHVLREHDKHESSSVRASSSTRPRSRCTRSTPKIRLDDLKKRQGIGYCNITKCCTKVCPESITITDNAIIPLKERVADRFYDPIKKLFRVFTG
jgi:succinate dehydrogenase / fumarate reductase iron-sulfur subunit